MNIVQVLTYIEIFISVILVIIILLQQGGSGLGTVFGGMDSDSYRSKRGIEALFYKLTIFFVVAFVCNALALIVLN
jgi:protein translocase SecG subunit